MPKKLDSSVLKAFELRGARESHRDEKVNTEVQTEVQVDESAGWPSREKQVDGQFTVRAPLTTIERFRRLCRDDRRSYAEMLRILMDSFDSK